MLTATALWALFTVKDELSLPTFHRNFSTAEECEAELAHHEDQEDALCIRHLFPPRPVARPARQEDGQ